MTVGIRNSLAKSVKLMPYKQEWKWVSVLTASMLLGSYKSISSFNVFSKYKIVQNTMTTTYRLLEPPRRTMLAVKNISNCPKCKSKFWIRTHFWLATISITSVKNSPKISHFYLAVKMRHFWIVFKIEKSYRYKCLETKWICLFLDEVGYNPRCCCWVDGLLVNEGLSSTFEASFPT